MTPACLKAESKTTFCDVIHPSVYEAQVLLATHSPVIVSLAEPDLVALVADKNTEAAFWSLLSFTQ